jgi:hypothetical protein
MEIESFSKFRDKYYSILNNQNKGFSKKLGLFTLFSEKSKPEKIMNKIYDEIKRSGLTLKEYKKQKAKETAGELT